MRINYFFRPSLLKMYSHLSSASKDGVSHAAHGSRQYRTPILLFIEDLQIFPLIFTHDNTV